MSNVENYKRTLDAIAADLPLDPAADARRLLGEAAQVLTGVVPDDSVLHDRFDNPFASIQTAKASTEEMIDQLRLLQTTIHAIGAEAVGGRTVLPDIDTQGNEPDAASEEPDLPAHRRKQPAIWGSLWVQTKSILPKDFDYGVELPSKDHAEEVYDIVSRLDDDALEEARYYAIGEGMRYVEKRLKEPVDNAMPHGPNRLDQAIEAGAQQLADAYLSNSFHEGDTGGLTIADLQSSFMTKQFETIAAEACTEIPAQQRLLSDALVVVSDTRRMTPPGKSISPIAKSSAVSDIMTGTDIGLEIGRDTLSGMTTVYTQALRLKAGTSKDQDAHTHLKDIASDDELRTLVPQRIAIAAASIRQDQLLQNVDTVLTYEDSSLQFDRQNVPSIEESAKKNARSYRPRVLHREALGCPAVQVENLMADVRTRYPDIITKAQAIIAEDRRIYGENNA